MTWREQVLAAVGQGYDVLDWLSASDDPLTVTACLVSSERPSDMRLLSALAPVESIADIFASAGWHERETAEMFGITFGHGTTEPLLLPPGAAPPLRKQTPLSARVDQPWPGAIDPAKPRRVQEPPGTPWK